MKTHWFLVLGIAGIVLLAGTVNGGEVRWAKPTKSESVAPAVLHIPTVVSNEMAVPSQIEQVQFLEPIQQPPTLAPQVVTQPGTNFLETRPLDIPVPPGAALHNAPSDMTQRTVSPMPNSTATITTEKGAATACGDFALKSIKDISHDIRPTDASRLPEECVIESPIYYGRHFGQTCFMWKASALSTQAAYFEDVQLERYGNTIVCPALQPVVSGAKFFATIPILPYKMGVTPPNECVYTLGHRRPGNCAPFMVEPFPISPRGALFQAGAVAGTIAVIP